jgi:thiamine biosynthesis lipoprotein
MYRIRNALGIVIPVLMLFAIWWRAETVVLPPIEHSATRLLMGTLIRINTFTVPANQSAVAAWNQQEPVAVRQAFDTIARIETLASRHLDPQRHPEASVARINAAPRGLPVAIPAELATLLAAGLQIGQRSGHAFDMGLLSLTRLWGFSEERVPSHPPDPALLARWRQHHPSDSGIRLTTGADGSPQVTLENDAVGLDLGGLAKAYALEQAATVLRQGGIEHALIDAGGDVRSLGRHGDRPWRVGIRHPRRDHDVIAAVEMEGDMALLTSGDYERFFMHDGKRYHHILDPATGHPATGAISVSIQARNALLANGWSTSLMVLGADRGFPLLETIPGLSALLVTPDGQILRTLNFQAVVPRLSIAGDMENPTALP